MEINYDKLDKELNDFTINKIYELLSIFGDDITPAAKEQFENAVIKNRIIAVDQPSNENMDFFKGNIPPAHGPRTKKDGMIHIYPYIYDKGTNLLIKHYIDEGILTHELCHYIIKLDFESSDKIESDLGHFINEGAVQLLTEQLDKKTHKGVEYRKNVELASLLLTKIPTKNIFEGNLKEILSPEQFIEIKEEYLKQKTFTEEINYLVTRIGTLYNLDYQSIIRRLKRMTVSETICYLKEEIYKLPNILEKEEFLKEIDEISKSFNIEKEVTPKM